MKKKTKVLSGIALGLLVVLGVSVYTSGGALQGKFGLPTVKLGTITMSLDSLSPSGARAENASDAALLLDFTGSAPTSIPVGTTLTVNFHTGREEINTAATGDTVTLKNGSTTVGTGTISVTDTHTASAIVTTTSKVSIPATSSPAQLALTINSDHLLNTEPGVDDPLTIEVTYKSTTVMGNVLLY